MNKSIRLSPRLTQSESEQTAGQSSLSANSIVTGGSTKNSNLAPNNRKTKIPRNPVFWFLNIIAFSAETFLIWSGSFWGALMIFGIAVASLLLYRHEWQ